MKIALLHYTSPPVVGGVESVMAQQARLMAHAGHQVTILAGRGQPFDKHITLRLLPEIDSRYPAALELKARLDHGACPPAFQALRDQIQASLAAALAGCDVLIAHNVASLHKNLALTAALHAACQAPGFPRLVLWHHDLAWTTPRYLPELHPGYPWDLLRQPWPGVRQVVVSELRRQELAALYGLPPEAILVIPNGVDLNVFFKLEAQTSSLVESLRLAEADPLFLLPVRLTPRKNIELALHILAELRRPFPQAMLLVTGPEGPHNPANAAYRQKLADLRAALGLQGAAHFLADVSAGFIPDAVIADFYRLADALLFPSREEGFGIPLIEAAFSRLPVFCADIPVLHELGGADASYFDPDIAPAEAARQIAQRLQADPAGRWARRARRLYAWERIYTRQIEPLLASL